MRELLRRLTKYPLLSTEILIATFFIALLNLASPLYVINILNRYVGYGFDGTLVTLTTGMLIAVALQFAFRVVRTKMLGPVSASPDAQLSEDTLNALTHIRFGALSRINKARLHETAGGLQQVQSAYEANNLTAVLDAPFALLYIAACYFLNDKLALIGLGGMVCALLAGFLSLLRNRKDTESLRKATTDHRGLIISTVNSGDTVRAFEGRGLLARLWRRQIEIITDLRLKLAVKKEQSQSFIQTVNLLMTVVLYATGAVLVVEGLMTVGALIGANILASRAFQNVVKLVQTAYLLRRANTAQEKLKALMQLPKEKKDGLTPQHYPGGLRINDLAFAYQGSTGPLFESVTFDLKQGEIMAVIGRNGTGKTTLARLIVGLLQPGRGEILIDNINLRQLSPSWWRRQLIYFPQEPTFLNTTVRENLCLINPEIDDETLNQIVRLTDLGPYFDRTPQGLDTVLADGGRNLSLGIRRRLALARAFVTDGTLAVMDEPTEGMDTAGQKAVTRVMNAISKNGGTIIIFSHDERIIKSAHVIIDLNKKPVPDIKTIRV
ncbi:ATP-binding cassette domain-containing protein [Desulfococcaceae bacterium HSG9]|nr:ATP-binding cassette domain-containing protein [Desulfococcaceae bacterium HSG9]